MSERKAQKTGYYATDGRAIRDGDRVRGIIGNDIVRGEVREDDLRGWVVDSFNGAWSPSLWAFDDVEVLK